MSKKQKQISEQRHHLAQKYLEKHFPDCEVVYDGVEGFDHIIRYGDNEVFLETKTCGRIIRAGIKIEDGVFIRKFRFGQFCFNNQCFYPYKKSQHQDLIDCNGWYVFVVSNRIRGIPANVVGERLGENWSFKRIVWDKILFLSSPDWLEQLKKRVYNYQF